MAKRKTFKTKTKKRKSSSGKYKKTKKSYKQKKTTRYAGSSNWGKEIKTMDTQIIPTYGNIYVQDQFPNKAYPVFQTGVVQAINLVQMGAGVSQRISNKIAMKSILIKLTLNVNTAAVIFDNEIQTSRIMVVYDRQPNSGYPDLYAEILGYADQDGVTQDGNIYAPINPNNLERFIVMMDKILIQPIYDETQVTDPVIFPPGEQKIYKIHEYIQLKDLETVYNQTIANSTCTLENITTGALYIIVIGSKAAPVWSYVGTLRLRFNDTQ